MFISVKDAVELTGKSQTTIYRLCKKRIRTEFVKVENSQYLIDKDFLLETYPPEDEDELINIENEEPTYNESDNYNYRDDTDIELEIVDSNENISKIADEITKRIGENTNDTIDETILNNSENDFNFEKVSFWDSIVGVSISVLIIIGFILMLYFNSK